MSAIQKGNIMSRASIYRASIGLTEREFRCECMSRVNVPFPAAVSLPKLQSEIRDNESYIMDVGMTVFPTTACLYTMRSVLKVARVLIQRKHNTITGRRAVHDMRKAMAALKSM